MSSICTIIAPDACIGCREELVNLSKSIENKRTFEIYNKNEVYVGICTETSKNDVESIIYKGVRYSYCFCGELYNSEALAQKIKAELGYSPIESISAGVIATWCYILWGGFSPKMLSGKFAYAIYSEGIFKTSPQTPKLFIAKDRFGFIPLYYYQNNRGDIYISSSLESMLNIKGVKKEISLSGLWQAFYLNGMTLPNKTMFDDINQLEAGHCAYIDCRGKSKIMIKRYDNTSTYKPASDITLNQALENSFTARNAYIKENAITQDDADLNFFDIEKSVTTTLLPINPTIYGHLNQMKSKNTLISDIGKELMCAQNICCMRGFFSWISDPYENIELLNRDLLKLSDGFDFINNERLKRLDPDSEKYELDSLYHFYLPMLLPNTEAIAAKLSLNIKYPYCDEGLVEYLYVKNQACESANESKRIHKRTYRTKNSEFEHHLISELTKVISNSESLLNYISDKEKLKNALLRGMISDDIILLYSLHLVFDKFNLDLNIRA